MTPEPERIRQVAHEIAADISARRAYRARAEVADFAAGYAVQDAVVERLIATGTRSAVAGYKIAVNSAVLMERFGVTEPVSARIFADQVHEGPADLSAKGYRQFAFEPEIAAVIGADFVSGTLDRRGAEAIVERLVPALEILDLRGIDMPSSALSDVVAQNVTNAGAVLGGPGLPPSEFDPEHATSRLAVGDREVVSVTGGAPQHPLDVVAWMGSHLAARGLTLTAGMIVLCGTHAPIQSAAAGDRIAFRIDGLGEVGAVLRP